MEIGEIYDICDIDENVIGKASWEEIHKKGHYHLVVSCLVFDSPKRKRY